MHTESLFSEESEIPTDEQDQCPECGHIWTDDEQSHYHDCRYFVLNDEDDDEVIEKSEDPGKSIRSWEYRPAA